MAIVLTLLALALIGLLIGSLARLALPGPDPMPWWQTMLLGWAGALLAGIVTWAIWGRAAGIVLGVLGATVLLALHRKFVQHRPLGRG